MQQIAFKREFSIQCSHTKNGQHLEEKMQPIKEIVIKKSEKNCLKFENFEIQINFRSFLLHSWCVSTPNLYQYDFLFRREAQADSQTLSFIIIRDITNTNR